jgi:hypothetical protein
MLNFSFTKLCPLSVKPGTGIAQLVHRLGYRFNTSVFEFRQRKEFFSSLKRQNRMWGPSAIIFNGYFGSFPGIKRRRPEIDYSPTSTAKIKKAIQLLPPYTCIAWTRISVIFLLLNSTKLSRASSCVRCLKASKPTFGDPCLFPSSCNWLPRTSVHVIHTHTLTHARARALGLRRIKEENNILQKIKRRNANWIGHILRRKCILKRVIEGKLEGTIEVIVRRGRRHKQLLDDLTEKKGYCKLKEEALDRTLWRTSLGWSYGLVVRQATEKIYICP